MYKYLAIIVFISNLTVISCASDQNDEKRPSKKINIERLPASAKFTDMPDVCIYQILAYVTDITGTPRGNSVVRYTNNDGDEKETWFVNPQDLQPTIKYLYNLRLINKQLAASIESHEFSQAMISSLNQRFGRSDFPKESRDMHWNTLSIATSIKAPAGYRYLDEYVTTSGQYDLFTTACCIGLILCDMTGSIELKSQYITTDEGIIYYVTTREHVLIAPWFAASAKISTENNDAALINLLISQKLFQRCTVKSWGASTDETYLKQCLPIPTDQEELQPLANYFEPISATEIENLPAGSDIICRATSLENTHNPGADGYSVETFDGKHLPKATRSLHHDKKKEKVQKSLFEFMTLKRHRDRFNDPIDLSEDSTARENKSLCKYFGILTINEAPQDVIPTRPDSPFIDTTPVNWQESSLLTVRELNKKYMEHLRSEVEWVLFTADLTNKPHIQGEIENRIKTFGLRDKALCSNSWTSADKASLFSYSSYCPEGDPDKSYLWIKKDSVDKVTQKLDLNLVWQAK